MLVQEDSGMIFLLWYRFKQKVFKALNFYHFLLGILGNSTTTKCRLFEVKINCSKFIIDRLQSRCYLTFSFSLFLTSGNLLFDVFLPREKSRKYQASVTERCTSLSKRSEMFRQNLFQVPLTNLNL